MSRFARLLPIAGAGLAALSGCGSSSDSDAKQPTPASPTAERLQAVAAADTEFALWNERLTDLWGGKPKATWFAVKQDDGSWKGILALRGPAKRQLNATWKLPAAFGKLAAGEPVAPGQIELQPLDNGAKQLALVPPPTLGTADVRLLATVSGTADDRADAKILAVHAAGPAAISGGEFDEPLLRGLRIESVDHADGGKASVPLSASTTFRDRNGKAIDRAAFFAPVQGGAPRQVTITWRSVDPTVTYAKLLERAPTRLQWSTGAAVARTTP